MLKGGSEEWQLTLNTINATNILKNNNNINYI